MAVPKRDLTDPPQGRTHPVRAQPDLSGVAAELLAEGDGNGVHQVRAAGLDDVGELLGLALQRGCEPIHRRQQVVGHLAERRQVDGGGKDVVRRLSHVHVIVRMDVVAREVRDHLVGVRVRRGAGAGLEDVDRELVVVLARRHRVAGGRDPLADRGVEQAELGVDPRRGGLDPPQPAHDGDRNGLPGDEIGGRLAGLLAQELSVEVSVAMVSSVRRFPNTGGYRRGVSLRCGPPRYPRA